MNFSKIRLGSIENKFILQGRYFFKWITLPRFQLYRDFGDTRSIIEKYPQTYNTYEEANNALTEYKIHLGIVKPNILYETGKDD